jgi:hypothetical protein
MVKPIFYRDALYELAYTNNLPVPRGTPPCERRKKREDSRSSFSTAASRLTNALTAQGILSTPSGTKLATGGIASANLSNTIQPGRSDIFDAFAAQPEATEGTPTYTTMPWDMPLTDVSISQATLDIPALSPSASSPSDSSTRWSSPSYTLPDMTKFAYYPSLHGVSASPLSSMATQPLAVPDDTTSLWSTAPPSFEYVLPPLVYFNY